MVLPSNILYLYVYRQLGATCWWTRREIISCRFVSRLRSETSITQWGNGMAYLLGQHRVIFSTSIPRKGPGSINPRISSCYTYAD